MICANCNVHESRDDNEANWTHGQVARKFEEIGLKLPTCQHCADRAAFSEMSKSVDSLAKSLSEDQIKSLWMSAMTVIQWPEVAGGMPKSTLKTLAHLSILGISRILLEKRS